ncbi:Fic family protein [Polaromonas sp. AER18D-145]|uniref:Fic family protein n=1 Tax=Polaromonas sp. AER18D-145 TaxID=1977060 RepID=UPI000BBBD837|nr:Fic family protein [Polaromonas sp. AER18D-145]
MNQQATQQRILSAIRARAAGAPAVSSSELATLTGISLATLKRHLEQLVREQRLTRAGKARATRYSLPNDAIADLQNVAHAHSWMGATVSPPWSEPARALLDTLLSPLAARNPVTYQRKFVDDYAPNVSSLLPPNLAQALYNEGRMQGQQAAGTYARKVLEPLLIDLSWSSSRLEGNTYSLLATEQLFEKGVHDGSRDAVMLLNHKRAIEFMVDAVPQYGLTGPVISNLHSLLMQDLLDSADALGAIRTKVVNISNTVYVPTQVPSLLAEMLNTIVERARLIKNPAEAAFFLWINLAYLQPFEDGNKRTSRLAANIPLMLYNCAPLSFLDVDPHDYALAMIGVYELLDVSLASELFAWTYRRALRKYAVILESMGVPDPFRVKHRERLNEAIQAIVREGRRATVAMSSLEPGNDAQQFAAMLDDELTKLTVNNCARYRLTMRVVEDWIARGRPR